MTGRTASRLQPEGFSVNRLPISQPENLRNHVGLAPVIIQDAGTIVAKCRERAPEIRPEDGWCKRPPRTRVAPDLAGEAGRARGVECADNCADRGGRIEPAQRNDRPDSNPIGCPIEKLL